MGWFSKLLRTEKRADYSEILTDALLSNASSGDYSKIFGLAAAQACAGAYGRAFSAARVEPAGNTRLEAITPNLLEMVGRAIFLRGELALKIVIDDGGKVLLLPCADFDVSGEANPATWRYLATLATPGKQEQAGSEYIEASQVVHCRAFVDARRPWRGRSPLVFANATANLASLLEGKLTEEISARVGFLMPVPNAGTEKDVEGMAALRADLRTMKGQLAMVPSMAAAWGDGRHNSPRGDWKAERLGADPPASLLDLRESLKRDIYAAAGVPAELSSGEADGTANREAWRRFIHGTIEPVARQVAHEIREKLDSPDFKLDFSRLMASDTAGRARAFGSLVKAGLDVDEAKDFTGIEGDE